MCSFYLFVIDTSSTLNHTSNQDINDTDNSSELSESQSIDIKSINLNNNVSNDRDSLSNEIHNISFSNTSSNNHSNPNSIATKLKARGKKARKKIT